MGPQIIEIDKVKLAANVSEEELIAASERFQTEFLCKQPGYRGRDLVRLDQGSYADMIRWDGVEAAEAVLQKLAGSPACRDYFSILDADGGLTRHPILSSHGL